MGNCYHVQKSPRHNTIDAEIKSKKIPQSLKVDNYKLDDINDNDTEKRPEEIEKVQKAKRGPNNVFAQMANQYDQYDQPDKNDNYHQEYRYEVITKKEEPANNKKNQPSQKQQRKDDSDDEDQTQGGNIQAFIQEALKVHNEYRSNHGSPPLKINKDLNKIAQSYAEKIAKTNNFSHSSNDYKGDNLGENLYMCQGTPLTGKNMTQAWYDEIKDYDFRKGDCISGTGHFTQVIWADSKEVGFGLGKARDGSYYAVANYYPAGNFIGEFAENVKPIGGAAGKKSSYEEPKKNAYYQNIKQKNDSDDDWEDKQPKKAYNKYQKEDSDNQSDDNGATKQTMDQFIKEALDHHNQLRKKHHAPPLKINKELNQIALKYAEKIAKSNNFAHSSNEYKSESLGENLYMCQGTAVTGKKMTQSWYDEIKDYDFRRGDFSSGTGHFTQVVWVGSTEVGFGYAQSRDGSYYAVANYYPPGNFMGDFPANVKKA